MINLWLKLVRMFTDRSEGRRRQVSWGKVMGKAATGDFDAEMSRKIASLLITELNETAKTASAGPPQPVRQGTAMNRRPELSTVAVDDSRSGD